MWRDIKQEDEADENDLFTDEKEIEDWNDPIQTYFCLFCDNSCEDDQEILDHMINQHQFDLRAINTNNNLSFYNQVKLINYIRRQVYSKCCFVCKLEFDSMDMLRNHLTEKMHIKEFPSAELWDHPEFYFSTFEDDSMLCLLDDAAYDQDQSKFQVIPEQYDIQINKELMNDLKQLSLI